MSEVYAEPLSRAAELRRSFDAGFAAPRRPPGDATLDLLLVRVGLHPYAIPLSELRGLHEGRRVTPLPAGIPELLGIAGIRGELVPAYSLASLLRIPDGERDPRWLATCGTGDAAAALAFSGYEGVVRIRQADVHGPDGASALPAHTRGVARVRSETCYVVSTESILNALLAPAGQRDKAGRGGTADVAGASTARR